MERGLVPYCANMHKMISNCARDDKLTEGVEGCAAQRRRSATPGASENPA